MLIFARLPQISALLIGACLQWATMRSACAQVYLSPPPRSTSERVLDNAVVNGVRTSILRFRSELGEAEVLDFYRDRWLRDIGVAAKLKEVGGKSYLSVVYNDESQTVAEVRKSPFGGTVGTVSQVALGQKVESRPPSVLPLDADSTIVDIIESKDGPKRSTSMTVLVHASLEIVRRRWLTGLAEKGFKASADQVSKGKAGLTWLALIDGPSGQVDVAGQERRTRTGSPRSILNLVVVTSAN